MPQPSLLLPGACACVRARVRVPFARLTCDPHATPPSLPPPSPPLPAHALLQWREIKAVQANGTPPTDEHGHRHIGTGAKDWAPETAAQHGGITKWEHASVSICICYLPPTP
jgi:hypothetical protein